MNNAALYFIASGIWMSVSANAADWFASGILAIILLMIAIYYLVKE